jgi:hypothetical protein
VIRMREMAMPTLLARLGSSIVTFSGFFGLGGPPSLRPGKV